MQAKAWAPRVAVMPPPWAVAAGWKLGAPPAGATEDTWEEEVEGSRDNLFPWVLEGLSGLKAGTGEGP